MIVECEGFFRGLIVDHERPKSRIRFKDRHQIKSQAAFILAGFGKTIAFDYIFIFRATEQIAIILCRQRISFRQPRDLRILVIGRDENIIGLIKRILQEGQFVCVIVPINLQIQIAAIHSAKGIVSIKAEGQTPVIICLVGKGCAGKSQVLCAESFQHQRVCRIRRDRHRLSKSE